MEIPGIQIRAFVALVVIGTCLGACNGGSTGVMQPVAFTSFSAVTNGQPVQAKGVSQTMNIASTLTTTLSPVDTSNSSAQFTYTNIGTGLTPAMTAVSFTSPASSVSWSGGNVDCTTLAPLCSASNSSATGRVVNALDPSVNWNYQSFGYWINTLSLSSTVAGAMSFGSPTPMGGVPTVGGGAYNGRSGGVYIDPSGNLFTYSGNMTSNVDFSARTILFVSSVTQITPVALGTAPATSALGISASFSYLPGTTQFSGPVTAAGKTTGGLSGTLSGMFYGPTAQEIGGTFSLSAATGREAMVGGFGGKR